MTKLNYKTWLVVVLILLVSTGGVFAFASSNKQSNQNLKVANNSNSSFSSTLEIKKESIEQNQPQENLVSSSSQVSSNSDISSSNSSVQNPSQIVQTSQTIDPKNLTGVLGFATLSHQESFYYISAGDYKMIKIDTTNYDNSVDLKTLVGSEVSISSSFKDASNLTVFLEKITSKNPAKSNIDSASDVGKAGGWNYYLGDRKLIVLMCKYSDIPDEPQNKNYFETRLNGTTLDSTNTYWKAITDDQMTITGSATGWVTLPKPKSAYFGTSNYLVSQNDCITAADPLVNYQNYDFIQMVFNSKIDSFAAGLGYLGFVPLQLDGSVKNFGVTWLGDDGWRDSDIVQHEIGHNMGWDHSIGDGQEYGSKWDIMSGGGGFESSVSDYLGTDTSAYYKYFSGILPSEQVKFGGYSQLENIKLEKLHTFDHTDQKTRLVRLYTNGIEYTIEARKKEGYDKYIPESGVIVQKVLSSYWPQVEVIDTEGDNNINDTGSALIPGETYLFPGGQKVLKVISDYGTGYDIQIKDSFSVEITSPDHTARLIPGSNYQVVAEAEEFGGLINKVEFYDDWNMTNLIGTDLTAPYTLDMTNLAKGDYTVRAKAYTGGGLSKASESKNIVVADNLNYTTTIDGATLSYNHLTGVLNYQETYQSANSCDKLEVFLDLYGDPDPNKKTLIRLAASYNQNKTKICSQSSSIVNYDIDIDVSMSYQNLLNFQNSLAIINIP